MKFNLADVFANKLPKTNNCSQFIFALALIHDTVIAAVYRNLEPLNYANLR